MKRVDESHWLCPMCNKVFAYGDLYHYKTTTAKNKAGTPDGYCRLCTKKNAAKRKSKRRLLKYHPISAELVNARRRIEELRDLKDNI